MTCRPSFRARFFALASTLWLAIGAQSAAHASPTRSFELDSQSSLSEGKLDGTAIESDGTITAGVQTRRTELAGVPTVKCLLAAPDGSVFAGTGNDGKVFLLRDGVAKLFAETKQVMVTSLTRDAAGTLYAGTLPSGKIFAIDAKGATRELAAPKGAEHIWALAYDDKRKTLFAATGPEGKVFAIDAKGNAEVYYDSEDAHVMALALSDDGSLYIGTSDSALVIRLRGAGRAEVLYDFDASEVTALALRGNELAVVANEFPNAPKAKNSNKPSTPSPAPSHGNAGPTPPAPSAPPAGKGKLYYISSQGHAELLLSSDDAHFATVAWAPAQPHSARGAHGHNDAIYVGTGKDGHIERVRVSTHEHALLVDVDERQISALETTGPHPVFATADGAAVYEIEPGTGKREWTSKALDAGTRARFGQLYARASGAISLQTRSGNTDKPDNTWSPWLAPTPTGTSPDNAPSTISGMIQSPAARFLQVRVNLSRQDSIVYAIEAFYLQDNQPAVITEVSVEAPRASASGTAADKSNKSATNGSSTQYKLRWKVDNTDNDRLRYRLYSRRESSQRYRDVLRDSEVLTATEYNWETEAMPDGYYRMRVEASDELDNPEPRARRTRAESEPFLVDNTPPELPELRVKGDRIVGRAYDEQGPISRIEYSLDGFEWNVLPADDELLDSRDEHFSLKLSQLPQGNHIVVVRASDARDNNVTRDLEVNVR